VPRFVDDDSLWLLHARSEDEPGATGTRLRLRKVRAADPGDGGPLDIAAGDADPAYLDDDDGDGEGELRTFERSFASSYQICLSAARPGGWGTDCSTREDPVPFLRGAPELPQ
jgi:hypothetical protein